MYYKKESLWHEYFPNMSRHDVNSILCYVSKCNSTHLHRAVFIKLVSLIKGTLSGLRQFLATKSPLKIMKNALYFTSKALFILKIFKVFVLTFCQNGLVKNKVNFKFYDVKAWLANNCNIDIAQNLEK